MAVDFYGEIVLVNRRNIFAYAPELRGKVQKSRRKLDETNGNDFEYFSYCRIIRERYEFRVSGDTAPSNRIRGNSIAFPHKCIFANTITPRHLTIAIQLYAPCVFRPIEHRKARTPVAYSQVTNGVRCGNGRTLFQQPFKRKKKKIINHPSHVTDAGRLFRLELPVDLILTIFTRLPLKRPTTHYDRFTFEYQLQTLTIFTLDTRQRRTESSGSLIRQFRRLLVQQFQLENNYENIRAFVARHVNPYVNYCRARKYRLRIGKFRVPNHLSRQFNKTLFVFRVQ